MKKIITLIFLVLLLSKADLYSQLLINEVVCGSSNDWVEIIYRSTENAEMDISDLYITMYYGTNEALGTEPITIYSYDRPETDYDDRFVVVHLVEPGKADETDYTGDTNQNGCIDVYCNNYYNSLWNSDGDVAIDTDDDPSNGGIIDFIAYSNMDGSPNSTIESYIKDAQNHGQWQDYSGSNIQKCAVDIGIGGLKSFMSMSREKDADTNSLNDFIVTNFQTPGRDNIIKINQKGRKLFKSLRKKISIVPSHETLAKGEIPIFIYENCNIKLRIFSITGVILYESALFRSIPPGMFMLYWNASSRKASTPTGLYIGRIEATGTEQRISEKESVYIILSKYK